MFDRKAELGLVESSDMEFEKIHRIQVTVNAFLKGMVLVPPMIYNRRYYYPQHLQAGIPHVVASQSFIFEDWLFMAQMAQDLDEYNARREQKMKATLLHTAMGA